MKNWKTTVIGVCMIVGAVAMAVIASIDGDPTTIPDWGVLWATITGGAGLIMAKDAGVTGTNK